MSALQKIRSLSNNYADSRFVQVTHFLLYNDVRIVAFNRFNKHRKSYMSKCKIKHVGKNRS